MVSGVGGGKIPLNPSKIGLLGSGHVYAFTHGAVNSAVETGFHHLELALYSTA